MREAVVVAGGGPAGSAVAAACAGVGLPVRLVDPTPGPWPNTYGIWVDELNDVEALAGSEALARRWDAPLVDLDAEDRIALDRPYGMLDNDALRTRLRGRLAAGGGDVVTARVTAVTNDAAGALVQLDDGRVLAAGIVIDATGHPPRLAHSGRGPAPAWQTAFGLRAHLDTPVVPAGGMALMDWRTAPLGDTLRPDEPPSFLYALDLGDGRTLVEETVLASRPPLPIDRLERRLRRRLAALGVQPVGPVETERVAIPMGGPRPPRDQQTLAYGSAAAMVHPATGYQVGAALRRAPAVAHALATALQQPDARPQAVSAAGWQAIWPEHLARQRALYCYGLDVLCVLGPADIQRFFAAFFGLPSHRWQAYLSGAASTGELARIMFALARRLPPRLQAQLGTPALRRPGRAALRRLAPRG